MVNPPAIAVLLLVNQPQRLREAEALASRLAVPIVRTRDDSSAQLFLAVTEDHVELRDCSVRGAGVFVDFTRLDSRTISGRGSKNQPLIKAFGREVRTIVDATAGLGQDAALLACMGFRITAVERSPEVFALVEDGLRRAMDDDRLRNRLKDHLALIEGDARDVLRGMNPPPDAVYIDPMFPPKRKKSALPSKAIRLIRATVGDDEDAAALLEVAKATATNRIVVKRPTHAPPLADAPTMSYTGKLVRYDVYLAAGRPVSMGHQSG